MNDKLLKLVSLLVGIGIFNFWFTTAQATILIKMDLNELVGQSKKIIAGKAIQSQSRWSDNNRHIITETSFTVTHAIHGSQVNETVVVRTLGGTVDGIGMWVSGSPSFKVGDEAVLFLNQLKKGAQDTYYVTGMEQGVYPITRRANQQLFIHPRVKHEATLVAPTTAGLKKVDETAVTSPQPLETFIKQVKQTAILCTKEAHRCQAH
jgi:hypothetical protein